MKQAKQSYFKVGFQNRKLTLRRIARRLLCEADTLEMERSNIWHDSLKRESGVLPMSLRQHLDSVKLQQRLSLKHLMD